MNAETSTDTAVAGIAAAIGEPARARMLFCLLDGHARTSTELAVVAEVGPPTASAHLNRLRAASLVRMSAQGKHRYYGLAGPEVARALEGLSVLAGGLHRPFKPATPVRLREARTCYDHFAGTAGVQWHDRLLELGWLAAKPGRGGADYEITPTGRQGFADLDIDTDALRLLRRRLAYGCLDWSERRPHLGGALGAALLRLAFQRKWFVQDLDSRIVSVTGRGRGELAARFGVRW